MRDAPEEATEQHIGIHVFQRAPGYNSSEDSIVRTNARALRQKLAEYFSQEGSEENTVIEIPKGHYLPVFHARDSTAENTHTAVPALAKPPAHSHALPEKRRRFAFLAGIVALLVLVGIAGAMAWRSHQAAPGSVSRFWKPFMAGNDSLVIYSNALFVGDSQSGLKYAPPNANTSDASSGTYVDTYTGIGELASVYDLTRLFDNRHAQFTLKRSRLVTWDEARSRNLIFIGSVAENPSLRVLPDIMDFALTSGDGWAGIVNRRPQKGELALYSRPEHPLTRDYAILAFLPGMEQGRQMLIFSGLMTMGTEAAVEFACNPEGVQQILHYAGTLNGGVRPFEAVLETTLGGGVPLKTKLVAIHLR